jgi:hypothetical protein
VRKHLSPGAILGTIAIVLAMTGSAVAASKITGAQIKDGTVTGKDIKNDSVTLSDLSAGTVNNLAGEQGPAGPAGPTGPAGPAGVARVVTVNGPTAYLAPGTVGSSLATCPPGSLATGGGWDGESSPPVSATVGFNKLYGSGSWGVIMVNQASISATYHAFVVCASGSGVVASRVDTLSKSRIARDAAVLGRSLALPH